MITFYLIRHAHSVPSSDIPHEHWPLSDNGERQANALVPFLQRCRITDVHSSPYNRAIDTIRPFANAARLPINISFELRERDLSPHMHGDFERTVRRCFADPHWQTGKGESNVQVAERMRNALLSIWHLHESDNAVVASHGQAIAILLTAIAGSFGYEGWKKMGNPDIFRVTCSHGNFRWDGSSLRDRLVLPHTK